MLLVFVLCVSALYARDDFEVTAYFGLGIDTFAAAEQRLYLNPESTAVKQERAVGGFNFEYQLYDRATQLWVYGESMQGMRSAEVDCAKQPGFFACQQNLQGKDPASDLLFLIRNASSLEAHVGLRFEFLTLHKSGTDPANLYLKAEAGFLNVAGVPGSAMAAHELAVGVIVTGGLFQGSYVEGGWGRSDIFVTNRHRRRKVDAFLTWPLAGPVRAFAQITVDTDLGRGSDSMQSYVGLEFDLRHGSFGR